MSKTIRGGFKAQATGKTLDLYIYDIISWFGVNADQVAKALDKAGDVTTINVYINSPGGDVFEAFAIYNQLVRHEAEVVVYVDGLAASAASVVMMAGDTRKVAANAMIMIHGPWAFAAGSADDLRKVAEMMDKITASIVGIYASRTGVDENTITQWMADETWFNAEEALEEGFADEIVEAKQVSASFDLSQFKNTPTGFGNTGGSRAKRPPSPKRLFEFLGSVLGTPDTVRDFLETPIGETPMADPKVQPETPAETTPPNDGADLTNTYTNEQIDAKIAQLKADLMPVALGPVLLEGRTTDEADMSGQLEVARTEGYEQGMVYAGEVQAMCEMVDMADKAPGFIDAKLSLIEVRRRLTAAQAEQRKPVGDGGGSELGEKPKPEDKYRAEFKANGGEAKLGVTEDQYVASCVTTDAKGIVGK